MILCLEFAEFVILMSYDFCGGAFASNSKKGERRRSYFARGVQAQGIFCSGNKSDTSNDPMIAASVRYA